MHEKQGDREEERGIDAPFVVRLVSPGQEGCFEIQVVVHMNEPRNALAAY